MSPSRRALALALLVLAPALLATAPLATASPRAPIVAEGDAQLLALAAAEGWPGAGTPEDPIVLAGLSFDLAAGEAGLTLRDVTLHVTVTGATFQGTGPQDGATGIRMESAEHVRVTGSTFRGLATGIAAPGPLWTTLRVDLSTFEDVDLAVNATRADLHILESGFLRFEGAVRCISCRGEVMGSTFQGRGAEGYAIILLSLWGGPPVTVEGNSIVDVSQGIRVIGNGAVRANVVNASGWAAALDGAGALLVEDNSFRPRGWETRYVLGVWGHGVHVRRNDFQDAIFIAGHSHLLEENELVAVREGVVLSSSATTFRNNVVNVIVEPLHVYHISSEPIRGPVVVEDNLIVQQPHPNWPGGNAVRLATNVPVRLEDNIIRGVNAGVIATPSSGEVRLVGNDIETARGPGVHVRGKGGTLLERNAIRVLAPDQIRPFADLRFLGDPRAGVDLGSRDVHLEGAVGVHLHDNRLSHRIVIHNATGVRMFGNLIEGARTPLEVLNTTGLLVANNAFLNSSAILVGPRVEAQWSIQRTQMTNVVGGPFVAGNYWHGYVGTDVDGDGLGDAPHALGASPGLDPVHVDEAPLLRPAT